MGTFLSSFSVCYTGGVSPESLSAFCSNEYIAKECQYVDNKCSSLGLSELLDISLPYYYEMKYRKVLNRVTCELQLFFLPLKVFDFFFPNGLPSFLK
jgi:hypothetical protein